MQEKWESGKVPRNPSMAARKEMFPEYDRILASCDYLKTVHGLTNEQYDEWIQLFAQERKLDNDEKQFHCDRCDTLEADIKLVELKIANNASAPQNIEMLQNS